MPQGLPGLSLREKVLLWLAHVEKKGGENPGLHRTQAGISRATGLSQGHVSRTVAPLLEQDLLMTEDQRVVGFSRTLVGYRLTKQGQAHVQELESTLGTAPVEVRRLGSEPAVLSLGDAMGRATGPPTMWEAVGQISSQGFLDLEAPGARWAAKAQFQRELADAPPETPFVGRDPELNALKTWLRGQTPFLAIEGPGGIGKTTLAAQALRTIGLRAHVVWIHVSEWLTGPMLFDRLAGFLESLGRRGRLASDDPDALLESVRQRFRGFPILLVFDDVQKADVSVRRVLSLLARIAQNKEGLRLLLVGRDVDLPDLVRGHASRLRVPPLPDAEADQLLTGLGLSPPDRAPLVSTCHGNPLFLGLLARSPDKAARGVDLARFLAADLAASLPPEHWKLLKWTSAMRAPAPPEVYERLGLGSPAILKELELASLLVARADGRYDMHDLIRDSLYQQLEFRERAKIHESLAEAYRPQGENWLGVAEFIHHQIRAGRRNEAARWVFRHQTQLMSKAHEMFTRGGRP